MRTFTSQIRVYVENVRPISNKTATGAWLTLPATSQEIREVLDSLECKPGFNAGCKITKYEMGVDEVNKQLTEWENLEEVNYLAALINALDATDIKKMDAVMEGGLINIFNIKDMINLTYSLDNYELNTEVDDDESLGRYMASQYGYDDGPLNEYIDFARYGQDIRLNEGGEHTFWGYICPNRNYCLEKIYDGNINSIPDEYKIMLP